jgi:hypothetical protein
MFQDRAGYLEMLKESTGRISKGLQAIFDLNNLSCSITSGIVEKTESLLGYISCFPNNDKTKESIDGTLQIRFDIDSLIISVDVCFSNGEYIEDMGESSFALTSVTAEMIRNELKTFEERMIQTMANTLSAMRGDKGQIIS